MPALSSLLHPPPTVRRALHGFALLGLLAILVAGSIPGARAEVGAYASGVVLHGMTYAFLAALWFLGATGTPLQRALKAMLAIALMGAVDEWVQSFFPYRSGDVRDWLVDVTAATLASTVLAVLASRAPRPAPATRRR
ncbi:VanZ family protein [Massilia timonae]|uniref:VanZ like family protein n=1 Tax=Massilia timonae TaxID=47229 RepID=A0A1S2N968_9BURK|nr:VanZ family protein [Massilia timonae]OIJ41628.1 vanZ like family protein [Massilia timonae]